MSNDTERQIVVLKPPHDFFGGEVTYTSADYIGRGELGAIYRTSSQNIGHSIVIKVPHNWNKSQQVQEEYDLLTQISVVMQEKGRPQVVPRAALGELQPNKLPVMIMPYYEDTDLLIRRVRDLIDQGNLIEAEKQALKAAVDFLYIMRFFPQGQACTDRKIKDFYLGQDEQTTVIDWNVLRSDSLELRVSEIRLFGFLIHELFLERKGQIPFMPFDDTRWRVYTTTGDAGKAYYGVISVGLRWLLAQIVMFDPGAERTERDDLYRPPIEALEQWQALLSHRSEFSDSSVRDFVNTLAPHHPEDKKEYVIAAILADLKWRLDITDDDLLEKRRMALETLWSPIGIDAIRPNLARELERTSYPPDALHRIRRIEIREAESSEDWVTGAHLRRWEMLLEFIEKLEVDSNQEKKEIERRILRIGDGLFYTVAQDYERRENLKKLKSELNELQEILQRYSGSPIQALHQVEAELELRLFRIDQNDTPRLGELTRQMKELDRLLSDISEDHYLRYKEAERKRNTLLHEIAEHHLTARFIDDVRRLAEDDDLKMKPQVALQSYSVALVTAEIAGERTWFYKEFKPLIELVRFVDVFQVIDRSQFPSQLEDALRAAEQLDREHGDELDEVAGKVWAKRVHLILKAHVERAREYLEYKAQVKSWDTINIARKVYQAIISYQTVLKDFYVSLPSMKEYQSAEIVLQRWHQVIRDFEHDPANKEHVRALLNIFVEIEAEGFIMSDLPGYDVVARHRKAIEDILDDELQRQINSLDQQLTNITHQLRQKAETAIASTKALQDVMQQFQERGWQLQKSNESALNALTEQEEKWKALIHNNSRDWKKIEILTNRYMQIQDVLPDLIRSDDRREQAIAQLNNLYRLFVNGRILELNDELKQLNELSRGNTLTDVLLRESVNNWRVRVNAYERVRQELDDIEEYYSRQRSHEDKETPPVESLLLAERFIHDIHGALVRCPDDVFSEALYKHWDKIIQSPGQAIVSSNLQTAENKLKKRDKESFKKEKKALLMYFEKLKKDAEMKHKKHTEIFPPSPEGQHR